MDILHSQINPASAEFRSNMAHNTAQVHLLRERLCARLSVQQRARLVAGDAATANREQQAQK